MTDVTSNTSHADKTVKTSNSEYRFYFGLILLAALPICTLLWAYGLIRHLQLPAQGPIRAAWSEAQSITPRIFWG